VPLEQLNDSPIVFDFQTYNQDNSQPLQLVGDGEKLALRRMNATYSI
jgi:hypothetical protein